MPDFDPAVALHVQPVPSLGPVVNSLAELQQRQAQTALTQTETAKAGVDLEQATASWNAYKKYGAGVAAGDPKAMAAYAAASPAAAEMAATLRQHAASTAQTLSSTASIDYERSVKASGNAGMIIGQMAQNAAESLNPDANGKVNFKPPTAIELSTLDASLKAAKASPEQIAFAHDALTSGDRAKLAAALKVGQTMAQYNDHVQANVAPFVSAPIDQGTAPATTPAEASASKATAMPAASNALATQQAATAVPTATAPAAGVSPPAATPPPVSSAAGLLGVAAPPRLQPPIGDNSPMVGLTPPSGGGIGGNALGAAIGSTGMPMLAQSPQPVSNPGATAPSPSSLFDLAGQPGQAISRPVGAPGRLESGPVAVPPPTATPAVAPPAAIPPRADSGPIPPAIAATAAATKAAQAAGTQPAASAAGIPSQFRGGTPAQIEAQRANALEMVKQSAAIDESAQTANQANFMLDAMDREAESWRQGWGAENQQNALAALKGVGDFLHLDTSGLTGSVPSFQAYVKNFGTLTRTATAAVSSRAAFQEVKFIQESLPGPDVTGAGRKIVFDQMRSVNDFLLAKQQFKQQTMAANNGVWTPAAEAAFTRNVTPYAFLVGRMTPDELRDLATKASATPQGRTAMAALQREVTWASQNGLLQDYAGGR